MNKHPRTDAFKKHPYVLGHQLWEDFAKSLESDLIEARSMAEIALNASREACANALRDDPAAWSRIIEAQSKVAVWLALLPKCPTCHGEGYTSEPVGYGENEVSDSHPCPDCDP